MITTIAISKETKERLARIGRKGMTYDDIIKALLDLLEKKFDASKVKVV